MDSNERGHFLGLRNNQKHQDLGLEFNSQGFEAGVFGISYLEAQRTEEKFETLQ